MYDSYLESRQSQEKIRCRVHRHFQSASGCDPLKAPVYPLRPVNQMTTLSHMTELRASLSLDSWPDFCLGCLRYGSYKFPVEGLLSFKFPCIQRHGSKLRWWARAAV